MRAPYVIRRDTVFVADRARYYITADIRCSFRKLWAQRWMFRFHDGDDFCERLFTGGKIAPVFGNESGPKLKSSKL